MTRSDRSRFPHVVLPLVLLAPQLALAAIFAYWPAAETISAALGALAEPGAATTLLASPEYRSAAIFTAWSVPLAALTSLALALLLAVKAHNVMRAGTTYLAPVIWVFALSVPAAGVIAVHLSGLDITVIREALGAGDLASPDETTATAIALVVVTAWKIVPIDFVCLLAALHMIPRAIREAAALDCGPRWRRFRTVTLPLIAPVCGLLLVVNLALALFDAIAISDTLAIAMPHAAQVTLPYTVFTDVLDGGDVAGTALASVALMAIALVLFIAAAAFVGSRRLRPDAG